MHDEAEVGLVEAHAERRRGDQRLDPVGQQVRLELLALGGLGGPGVGGHRVALLAQQRRDVVGLRHGQRVDDARARQRIDVRRKPSRALRRVAGLDHRQPQRLAVQPAAQHQRVLAADPELAGDVVDDAVVGGGRGGQHRHVGAQFGDQRADAPVVGPEVVAPVRHAVRLVDHDEAGVVRQRGQHLVAKVGIVQPFRADQQHVEVTAAHALVDLGPVGDVARVDGGGAHAGPFGRRPPGCASAPAAARR